MVLLSDQLRSTLMKMKTAWRGQVGTWHPASQHLGGRGKRVENYGPAFRLED